MADLNSIEILLSAVSTIGPLTLGVILFLSPLGLPFPSALLVLGTGAFVQQGLLDWQVALLLAVLAPVLGDCTSYVLGRSLGGWARNSKRCWAKAWHRAEAFLGQHGTLAVYVTRFLFPALDVPTNLLAGSSDLAFCRFLASAAAGRVTWVTLYGGLGYASGSQWEAVGRVAGAYGGWLGGLMVVGLGVYGLLRRRLATAAGRNQRLRIKIRT